MFFLYAIHTSDTGNSDMLGIGAHVGRNHALSNVQFRKLSSRSIELYDFDMLFGDSAKMTEHNLWRSRQFLNRQARQDKTQRAVGETLDQFERVFLVFFILATTDYRRVHIDSRYHSYILARNCFATFRSAQRIGDNPRRQPNVSAGHQPHENSRHLQQGLNLRWRVHRRVMPRPFICGVLWRL